MPRLQIGGIDLNIDTVRDGPPALAVDFNPDVDSRQADAIMHLLELALSRRELDIERGRADRDHGHYEIRGRSAAVMADIAYDALSHLSHEVKRGVSMQQAIADMEHHLSSAEEQTLPPLSSTDRLGKSDWVALRSFRVMVTENLDNPVLEVDIREGENLSSKVRFEQAQKILDVIRIALDEEGIQCEPIVLERHKRSYQFKLMDPKSGYTSKEMFEAASRILHWLNEEFDKPKHTDEILDGMLQDFAFDPVKGPMTGEKGMESGLEARLRKAITVKIEAFNKGPKKIDDPALVDELVALGLEGKFTGKPLRIGDAILTPPEENNLQVLVKDKLARHLDRNNDRQLIRHLAGELTEAIYNVRSPHRGAA
jgi:hypothetical protein